MVDETAVALLVRTVPVVVLGSTWTTTLIADVVTGMNPLLPTQMAMRVPLLPWLGVETDQLASAVNDTNVVCAGSGSVTVRLPAGEGP